MPKQLTWLKKTLDAVLIERKIVQENQLSEIRAARLTEGGGWAGHLVDAGCLTENELLNLVIKITGLPYISLLGITPSEELIDEFTINFLKTFECYPIDKIGQVIVMATPNPFQPEILKSRISQTCEIKLFVCRVSEWREKIRRIEEEIKV